MRTPYDMDDLEAFLSEQAEQHRMYPDDSVWRNIQNKLHGPDKWPALTFASIFTGAVITALLIFTHPNKEILNINDALASLQQPSLLDDGAGSQKTATEKVPVIGNDMLVAISQKQTAFDFTKNKPQVPAQVIPINSLASLTDETIEDKAAPEGQTDLQEEQNITLQSEVSNKRMASPVRQKTKDIQPLSIAELPGAATTLEIQQAQTELTEAATEKNFKATSLAFGPDEAWAKKINKKSRWNMQFYATPSVSYRYLIDDKRNVLDPSTGPFAPFMTQPVNGFVRQRPRLGLEAGVAMLYELSDNFRLKTGVQLNYRQFIINAYTGAQQPATVELNRGNNVEALVQMTSISNIDGWRPVELQNQFLQLAIPLGFDLKMAEFNSVDFYMSAAGQFTYQLASKSYMISSDFKNFVPSPSNLERRFNINTAIEAFAAFKAGGMQWQIGPQIRYQLMPGSKSAYPIREHLIDYGLKIGVVKQLK